MLDFSVLKDMGKVVIQCRLEDDATILVEEMWKQYPELMNHWSRDDIKWRLYKDDTCYAPHIYDGEASCMQYCNTSYWISEGYLVIQFETLTAAKQDFGEFEKSSIDLLDLWRW